jgi:hypothetical protein
MITVDKVLNDPSVSYWLKNALTTALNNDPVDAVNDAELLLAALKKNLEAVFEVG